MSSFDWIGKWSIYTPNKIAIFDYELNKSYSYKSLNTLAEKATSVLINKFNIEKGKRIAVLAENCIEYVALFGAAQKLGFVLVPLNYRLTSSELEYIIKDSDPSLILVDSKYENKISESISKKYITVKLEEFSESINSFQDIEPKINSTIDEDDTLFILYTSGTTAFPKGSVYTHKMLFWNSINTELRLNLTSDDSSINCAPPFHTGSWNVLFTPFLHHGATTILMKNFDPDNILKIIEQEKITIWWAVPTMLKMLSQSQLFEKTNFEHLRYFIVGGEALPLSVIQTWHNRGVPIRQGYGLTEVGPNVTSLNESDAENKIGSIGTPNFYYEIKIIDLNGNEIKSEGTGELLIKSETVTPGYWRNDEATEKAIVDGWFCTGDVVRRDSEGFLFVVDRLKNMYISGGENVYPAEVEHLLRKHPAVDQIAIIGIPDEKWGESGKAFVVKKMNQNVSEDELKQLCMENLAKYKIPKYFEFIEKLPLTDSGKIDRKKLRSLK